MAPEAAQPAPAAGSAPAGGDATLAPQLDAAGIATMNPNEVARLAAKVAFTLLAARLGEHWALSPTEERTLGEAWGPVLAYVLPKLPPIVYVAGIAVVATTSVVMPRLRKDKELAEIRAAQEREGSEHAPSVG